MPIVAVRSKSGGYDITWTTQPIVGDTLFLMRGNLVRLGAGCQTPQMPKKKTPGGRGLLFWLYRAVKALGGRASPQPTDLPI
jgi:hypothetical protein